MDLEPSSTLRLPQVPSGHQLRAALKAAEVYPNAGSLAAAKVGLAFDRLATEGLYSAADLRLGNEILRVADLLNEHDGADALALAFADLDGLPEDGRCAELLARYVTARPPLWLDAAAGADTVAWALVPDHEAETLEALVPDAERREELLLALARRVDPERDKRTGNLAEDHVVAECRAQLDTCGRADLAERVERVSLRSDQLGYDVTAPRMEGTKRRIEVKGTLAQGSTFSITLSRNEAKRALRDPDWSLVACRVGHDDSVVVIGWCAGPQLEPYMPADPPERGRWRSVEILLGSEILTPGLPPC